MYCYLFTAADSFAVAISIIASSQYFQQALPCKLQKAESQLVLSGPACKLNRFSGHALQVQCLHGGGHARLEEVLV